MDDKNYLLNLLFMQLDRPYREIFQTCYYAIYGGHIGGRTRVLATAAMYYAVKHEGKPALVHDVEHVIPVAYEVLRDMPTNIQKSFVIDKKTGTIVYKGD